MRQTVMRPLLMISIESNKVTVVVVAVVGVVAVV